MYIEETTERLKEQDEKCKERGMKAWSCHKCGRTVHCYPAMSRVNGSDICSLCGVIEAFEDMLL